MPGNGALSAQRRENPVKRRYDLYKQGFSDEEIALKLNYSQSTIENWRNKRGLPSNQRNGYENDIFDSMVVGPNKNWFQKRINYVEKQLQNVEQIINCQATLNIPKVSGNYKIILENRKTKTEVFIVGIESDQFISNIDYQLYIDEKIKSAMINFIRKRYNGKS